MKILFIHLKSHVMKGLLVVYVLFTGIVDCMLRMSFLLSRLNVLPSCCSTCSSTALLLSKSSASSRYVQSYMVVETLQHVLFWVFIIVANWELAFCRRGKRESMQYIHAPSCCFMLFYE